MGYTAPEWIAIITALVTLVSTLTASIITVILLLKTKGKVAEVIATTDNIARNVDGAATAAAAKADAMQKEIELLRDWLADKDKTAATLVQAQTSAPRPGRATDAKG